MKPDAPLVWPRARRRLAFVNGALPRVVRGPTIPYASLDVVIETDAPFITGSDAEVSEDQATIAGRIAALVPDGAALQTGIGGAPAAALARLMPVTGLAIGSEEFMQWAASTVMFADARTTHGADALVATPRLFAINSALEVDLFGQANIEWRSGRLVSGLGGAPDFARAARRSVGGRAILALPATANGGQISRIAPRLQTATVSIPRDDADLVITEYGVADLRGASLDSRAEALMAIAAPEHRDRLSQAWTAIRETL